MKLYYRICAWYYDRLMTNAMYYEAKKYYHDKYLKYKRKCD